MEHSGDITIFGIISVFISALFFYVLAIFWVYYLKIEM